MTILVSAAATGTTGSSIEYKHSLNDANPIRTFHVSGTFAGGTNVAIQMSEDDSTWWAVPDADTITAEWHKALTMRVDYVRAVITGGAADSINVSYK